MLNKIIPLIGMSLVGLTTTQVFAKNAIPKDRPNVLIINFDDMGYGDTEPFGMTGIPTPNFNKLAQQGTRFTHFNVAQAVCTASRASLLTGCYSNRVSMSGALLPFPTYNYALNPKEETIASMLKKVGYKTEMLGKWHLGNKPPFFPIHYGFDKFYGIPYSHDIWPVDYDGYSTVTDPKDFRSKFPLLPLISQDNPVDTIRNIEDAAKLTTIFTEKAVSYIHENKKNPFFLIVNQPMPHVPLAVSDKFKGKSELGIFGDVIMELDWSVGQIMQALDEEKLASNTILIVISDNGPWLHFGNNAGSAGGFREGKGTSFDGGTRVPCIIRWPEKVAAGDVESELMTTMDILPTIAAATGAPLPTNKIDGLNFLPLLTGTTKVGPREIFYYYYGFNKINLEAIRYKHWKLDLPHPSISYENLLGKDRYPGKTKQINVPLALYDLSHDPGERYDVSGLYPDVVAKIQAIAEEAREDLGDDLTNRKGKNVREPAFFEK